MTGITLSGGIEYTYPFIIINKEVEIFKISKDGDIYYRYNDEMKKVECPDELSQAFQESVIQMTGMNYENLIIEKFMKKLINHERSNDYITKLEKIFRRVKLEKLKNK